MLQNHYQLLCLTTVHHTWPKSNYWALWRTTLTWDQAWLSSKIIIWKIFYSSFITKFFVFQGLESANTILSADQYIWSLWAWRFPGMLLFNTKLIKMNRNLFIFMNFSGRSQRLWSSNDWIQMWNNTVLKSKSLHKSE